MITVLGKDGAPNKTYIEYSEDRNVVNNQASAPITLDPPPFSGISDLQPSQGCEEDEEEDAKTCSHPRGESCGGGS